MSDTTTMLRPSSPDPSRIPISAAAVMSLVLGLLSFPLLLGNFLTPIPAIICGHVSRSNIRKSGGQLRGKGIATAGLILGYLAFAFWAVMIPLFLIPMIRGDREQARMRAARIDQIASDDGQLHIGVPGNWIQLPQLNAKATIHLGNKDEEKYVIVLKNPKADYTDMTLAKYHQATRETMLKSMTNSSATEPESVTIDGQPAWQDELRGTQGRAEVAFVHASAEDSQNFYQILAWTLQSRWPAASEQLHKVALSFRAGNQGQ